MEEAKNLIRTAVRTFFPNPRAVLIIDGLLKHSVLHLDDFNPLIAHNQAKDTRSLIKPLLSAQLVDIGTRSEVRIGSQRGVNREYYYIPFHKAIDAVKYRIVKLRKRVEEMYSQDEEKRREWRCLRCKAEYDELEVLDKINDAGFYCDRCGATLVHNEAAQAERGKHEKIRRLNAQLKKFDDLIIKIDQTDIPRNDFLDAWERKKDVPRAKGEGKGTQYVEVSRDKKNQYRGPEFVKTENLAINLTSGAVHDKEEVEKREERKRQLAKQNQLPSWHTNSAIGLNAGGAIKNEDAASGDPMFKKEDDDEKKPDQSALQDDLAKYMLEMEREREEAERRAREEEDDDEDDFEDVSMPPSVLGTPMSSNVNGVKRERDFDDESSEANTPMDFERDSKRVKFENGNVKNENSEVQLGKVQAHDADSEEDEDFEDAI